MRQVLMPYATFLLLTAASVLAARRRGAPSRLWARSSFRVDAAYWIATPLVAAATAASLLAGAPVVAPELALWLDLLGLPGAGLAPAHHVPAWALPIAALLVADFAVYWIHRAFHRGRLWRVHAVHHSSQPLDWHSALRIHPLERVALTVGTAAFLIVLGFPLAALAIAAPIARLIAVLVHLDVDVDLGPLRYVVATPAFHRWHHADGQRANFAGLFPVWDLLFGTFHMPRDARPTRFGAGEPMPEGFLAQLAHPFRRRAA